MKRAILASVLFVAACAAPATNPPSAPAPIASPPPQPPPAPPRQEYVAPTAEKHDRCGADQLQWLVGRSKLEIPVPLEPGRRRVVCTTCPMTRDYNEFRQTILFDAGTSKVTSVACN